MTVRSQGNGMTDTATPTTYVAVRVIEEACGELRGELEHADLLVAQLMDENEGLVARLAHVTLDRDRLLDRVAELEGKVRVKTLVLVGEMADALGASVAHVPPAPRVLAEVPWDGVGSRAVLGAVTTWVEAL